MHQRVGNKPPWLKQCSHKLLCLACVLNTEYHLTYTLNSTVGESQFCPKLVLKLRYSEKATKICFDVTNVTIICCNDELSLLFSKRFRTLFILFTENSQILLTISVILILSTFIYLVVLNLLVNNQLNSLSNSTHHCVT